MPTGFKRDPQRALALQGIGRQGVFCITGGGSPLISELLVTPGASKTVLEVTVPYAGSALAGYLGRPPEQACAESTARALAMAAFQRARTLSAAQGKPERVCNQVFGFACTASLATDRIKRGEHRAHIALQTDRLSLSARYDFSARSSRVNQEKRLTEAQWQVLNAGLQLGIGNRLPEPDNLRADNTTMTTAKTGWRELVLGRRDSLPAAGFRHGVIEQRALLLPGAFNPLHEGHRAMLAHAEQRLGISGAFELSISNVDKPTLDYSTIGERLKAFAGRRSAGPLWLTGLPTFIDKARSFPGVTFVVGADTVLRIGMQKYYGSAAALKAALTELAALETRFLVFGRTIDGRFQTLADLRLPKKLKQLCAGVAEPDFRRELSSTELRRTADPG